MNNFFDQAFNYLIVNEGFVYTNDPLDSGGPTKFGITQKTYEEYLGRIVPVTEIKDMSSDVAKKIYFERYWKPLRCEDLVSLGMAICIFDSAVLYGPGTAGKLAQMAASLCGATLKFDGILGDKSITILNMVKPEDFLKLFRGLVLSRINSVIKAEPKDEKYRAGWTNRANRLLTLENVVPVISKTV